MIQFAHNTASVDSDFYLEASAHYPLLTAASEKRIDLQKWAAARRCIRMMAQQSAGRALLLDFCRACLETPPEVDQFEPRSLYFNLRKDIVCLLSEGEHAACMQSLSLQLDQGKLTANRLVEMVDSMHWPTTLSTGLAIILLRNQGAHLPDLVADAMLQWQPRWAQRKQKTSAAIPRSTGYKLLSKNLQRYTAARDKFVMHNLRLVHKLAWDHPGKGVPQRDLVQEGIVGLIRAAEKFDTSRGFRFTTYAYPWINQHLQRATENRGGLISYPAHVMQEINHLHKVRLAHQEATGHDPGVAYLAQATGFELDKVNKLRRLSNITVSIDHGDAEDNDLRRAANIVDPDSGRAVEDSEQHSVQKLLKQHIEQLDPRERAVLYGRWSLDGRPQRTFAQLAEQLEVSREWVRQLEKSALQKLGQDAALSEVFEEMYA